ncbi:MAG: hypothetical protein ACE366_31080 [Bradymonadia bacterium]
MSRQRTLQGSFPLPKGFCLAAAILLVVELAVARPGWVWSWNNKTYVGVMEAVERQVIAQRPTPKVLVMGSSRPRDAVAPDVVAQAMGLPAGAVMNVALAQGTPRDALAMYTRHRGRLSGAEVLLLGLDDWQLNAGYPPLDRAMRAYGLSERLQGHAMIHQPKLIAGWVWKTYDIRRPLRRMLSSLHQTQNHDVKLASDGRIVRKSKGPKGPETFDVAASGRRYLKHWQLNTLAIEHVQTLKRMTEEDGVQLLIFEAPLRDRYVDWVEQHRPQAWGEYREALASLSIDGHLEPRASAFGLMPTDFYDYGHVTPHGAEVFSAQLGRWLLEAGRAR